MEPWLQWLTSGAAVTALGATLATYLKTRPAMKAAQLQGEQALWARVNELETKLDARDDECERRIERMTERADAAMAEMKAEVQVLRHDRNNVRAGFNALLAMIKRLDNAELSSIAGAVEEMVSRGDQAIAIEKAAIPMMKGAT